MLTVIEGIGITRLLTFCHATAALHAASHFETLSRLEKGRHQDSCACVCRLMGHLLFYFFVYIRVI